MTRSKIEIVKQRSQSLDEWKKGRKVIMNGCNLKVQHQGRRNESKKREGKYLKGFSDSP